MSFLFSSASMPAGFTSGVFGLPNTSVPTAGLELFRLDAWSFGSHPCSSGSCFFSLVPSRADGIILGALDDARDDAKEGGSYAVAVSEPVGAKAACAVANRARTRETFMAAAMPDTRSSGRRGEGHAAS